ncbi:MAG: ribulose bisphosphate carboxylase small subunit [Kineosporiaceae bacterium]|jgi:ribulose-bisphosphate carboxylase small chain
MTIEAFRSRVDDPASRKFGTFSYLQALTREEIVAQVRYIIDQDWTCSIEHVEPGRAADTYWYLWKLPMFGVTDVDTVMAEVDACHEANPGDHVRLVGIDRRKQTQGLSVVVYRGEAG